MKTVRAKANAREASSTRATKDSPPCIKQTAKKYMQRKAPPYPANKCTPDTIATGHDGKTYRITVNSKGVHRWISEAQQKVAEAKKMRKKKGEKDTARTRKASAAARAKTDVPPCTKQTTKKYMQRKSPPYPANKCTPDTIATGNDGKKYKIAVNKNGIHRWCALSDKKVRAARWWSRSSSRTGSE